jgi:DNA-binding CsgD family transcriptional regulator
MGIHEHEISHPRRARVSATFVESARVIAAGLELRDQRRLGGSREQARARVARRLGWSPGTLYNLARERLKKLDGDLRTQLAEYAVRDLESEIASLTTELAAARRLGGSEDPALVRKISAVLAEAQALHDQMVGGAR